MNYCVTIWGSTYKKYLDCLVKFQKRALRFITGSKWGTETGPLFQQLKITKLSEIYVYAVQLFCFKFRNQLLQETFSSFFTYNHEVHNHYTRQKLNFHVPRKGLQQASKTIKHIAVRIDNYLHSRINQQCTYLTFKKNLKQFILGNDVTFLVH